MRWVARGHLDGTGRSGVGHVGRSVRRTAARRVRPAAGGRLLCLAIVLAAVVLPEGRLSAQRAMPVIPPPLLDEADPAAPNPYAAVLHASEEATTLLSRAQEGAARQDWKLVVDSLQRIIDLPGDHILETTPARYESARQHAWRQLGAMPPEGLKAYRLIYDGEAAAIYAQAVAEHDEAALRRLVDRSLLSSHGDDAAVTLADWLIDEGRFLEAGMLLRRVRSVYSDSDLPRWAVPARLAVCLAGMGRPDEARAILDELETGGVRGADGDKAAERVAQVRAHLGRLSTPERASANSAEAQRIERGWPMAYGRASRDGLMSPVEPSFINGRHSPSGLHSPLGVPWNAALPVPQPGSGTKQMEDYAAGRQLVPAAEIGTDGRVIVVKSGANLLGLDRDTFEPLWTTRTQDEEAELVDLETEASSSGWPSGFGAAGGDERLSADPLFRRLYYDSVGSQICLADGLAMSVEWPNEPPDTVAYRQVRGIRRHGLPSAGASQSSPNFVVAHALDDGRRVWMSDTSTGPAGLGPVEFLAAPTRVDDVLFVPCRLNDDMYAVLLDPRTGGIVRHVYLCGTGGAPFDSLYALTPCAADGMVFVPTGRGVLIAIDAATWSIQWAVRYDHVGSPVSRVGWLPTPAMAVGDVVLLAAADCDELLCFDRMSGELRWHSPRGKALYVLSAGPRHGEAASAAQAADGMVWTVGEEVYGIDLETGRQVWSQPCAAPAGRGARSGDRLYLPTRSGLYVLNAADGTRAEARVIDLAPGNLLAYEDSLYVVSAFEVRKYPDMKRGYDQAVLAHSRKPADLSLSMRLAWLEYLRGEPARALEALAGVPDSARGQDEKRYERLVHLRLLALLELAASPDTTAVRAAELLRQAQQIAESTEDAIAARLALGEHYLRSGEAGATLKACLEYAALALDPTGDAMVGEEGSAFAASFGFADSAYAASTFEGKAALQANRRLADLLGRLSPEEARTLADALGERLGRAVANRDTAELRRFALCDALGEWAVRADLALAVGAFRDLAFEQAEACLRRAIGRAGSPETRAEAVARLAVVYLQPGELQMPVAATGLIGQLEREFAGLRRDDPASAARASVAIPASILDPDWPAPGLRHDGAASAAQAGRAADAATIGCAEAAKALRKRIDSRLHAAHADALGAIPLGAVSRPPAIVPHPDARPIVVRGERPACAAEAAPSWRRPEALADRTLMLVEERTVEARRAADGELLWPAELRLAGEMVVESRTGVERQGMLSRVAASEPAHGLVDGQTLIINTRFGIHAVGLRTGRRLWSRRFDPPILRDESGFAGSSAGSDACVWVHDGYVISVDRHGCLEVARSEAGGDVLWRRRMLERQWQTVRASGGIPPSPRFGVTSRRLDNDSDGGGRSGCLVVGDAGLQHVDVFRLADGTPLGVADFTQPQEGERAVNIAITPDAIWGPISPRHVAALDPKAPGVEPRWRIETGADLSQVFKPSADTLAVADRAGGVKLIDAADGRVRLSVRVPVMGDGAVDGRLDGGVLYLMGLQKRFEAPRGGLGLQQWAVAAVRVEDGAILWSEGGLGPQMCVTADALVASSNAIPLLVYRPASGEVRVDHGNGQIGGITARRARVELRLLDKKTGAAIGEPVAIEVDATDGSATLLDLQVWPKRVEAFVGASRVAFETGPAADGRSEGAREAGARP